jgi:hypothetical protein
MGTDMNQIALKAFVAMVALIICASAPAMAQTLPTTAPRAPRGPNLDGFYRLGPDSLPQNGVPHGTLIGPTTLPTKVYAGRCPSRRARPALPA